MFITDAVRAASVCAGRVRGLQSRTFPAHDPASPINAAIVLRNHAFPGSV